MLDKTGCVITISDELVDKNNGYIKATVELSDENDSISVDAFARESVGKKGMDDPQMTGTASTYAQSMLVMVCLQLTIWKILIVWTIVSKHYLMVRNQLKVHNSKPEP